MQREFPSAPLIGVGAVVVHQGRVLLIRRGHPPNQGLWTLPGGRVERGETLAAALGRELYTETGLTAKCGALAEVFEIIDDRYHYVILDYLMSEPEGELRAGDDATAARFVALADLTNYPTTDGLAAVLKRALGHSG